MLLNFIEVLLVILPLLIAIAYLTLAERKGMGSIQRRIGPNKVGVYGILQPFSDGVKLLMKETIIPSQSDRFLFLMAPILSLTLSFLAWPVIPFAKGVFISDLNISIFYILAISSLSGLVIIIAGWGGNSKYALSGSIRSAAQLISYEIIISMTILIILFMGESFKISDIVIRQESFYLYFVFPLAPFALIFFISILAETNRAPFDLPEAKPYYKDLVSLNITIC